MGEREKILLVEDSDNYLDLLTERLEWEGHEIVATAKAIHEVRDRLIDWSDKITVAIIDNCMPDEGDGEKAALIIKQKNEDIIIISLAGHKQNWGHLNLEKSQSLREICEAIKRLNR